MNIGHEEVTLKDKILTFLKRYSGYYRIKSFNYRLDNWLVKHNFRSAKGSYLNHARKELKLAGYDLDQKEEDPNKWLQESVLELLSLFSSQGHSGFSAPYCIKTFEKLARFEPLTPLTGEEEEWVDVGCHDGVTVYQNSRIGSVFKDGKDGKAYWSEGIIFRDADGHTFTSRDSRVFIEFPWVKPEPEIVDVGKE